MAPAQVLKPPRAASRGRRWLAGVLVVGCSFSCVGPSGRSPEAAGPPGYLLGSFVDDYDSHFTLTEAEFIQHPRSRYRIVRWDLAGAFFVAQNGLGNPSDGGRWTRVDWIRLDAMAPWEWAFCFSAWKAETRAIAESTSVAQRATPRSGCAGHPFSRMKRDTREAPEK
jgi:hypothetical protein